MMQERYHVDLHQKLTPAFLKANILRIYLDIFAMSAIPYCTWYFTNNTHLSRSSIFVLENLHVVFKGYFENAYSCTLGTDISLEDFIQYWVVQIKSVCVIHGNTTYQLTLKLIMYKLNRQKQTFETEHDNDKRFC